MKNTVVVNIVEGMLQEERIRTMVVLVMVVDNNPPEASTYLFHGH